MNIRLLQYPNREAPNNPFFVYYWLQCWKATCALIAGLTMASLMNNMFLVDEEHIRVLRRTSLPVSALIHWQSSFIVKKSPSSKGTGRLVCRHEQVEAVDASQNEGNPVLVGLTNLNRHNSDWTSPLSSITLCVVRTDENTMTTAVEHDMARIL